MGFSLLVPVAGWTAAALGAAAGGTATVGRAFKEQLGWSELDAAREELNQGKYRGYNPNTGNINRSWAEEWRDGLLGNDPQEIQRLTRDLQKTNIKEEKGSRVNEVNKLIQEAGGTDLIKIDHTSTLSGIQDQIDSKGSKAKAVIQGQADAPDAGITMDTPLAEIAVKSRKGRRSEDTLALIENPIYQNQLRQQNLTNQLALGQMALSEQRASNQMQIAMMNNQLERRRMDMKESRLDRRDRQAMIQQMMAGLSTLGASIAI